MCVILLNYLTLVDLTLCIKYLFAEGVHKQNLKGAVRDIYIVFLKFFLISVK